MLLKWGNKWTAAPLHVYECSSHFVFTVSGKSSPISLTCLLGPILPLFNHVFFFCSLLDLLQFLDSSETVEAKCGHGAPRRICLGLREAEEVSVVSGLLGGEGAACLSAVETFNFSSEARTQFPLRVKEQFWGALGRPVPPTWVCLALRSSIRPSVCARALLLHHSYVSLLSGPQISMLFFLLIDFYWLFLLVYFLLVTLQC